MTEYKPDVDNLKSIVEKAHFAITGDKDEQMKERLLRRRRSDGRALPRKS